MAHGEDALGELIGSCIVLVGLVGVNVYLERKAQEEEQEQRLAMFLLEGLLNDEPGSILGDSSLGFQFSDPLDPGIDEVAALESLLSMAEADER